MGKLDGKIALITGGTEGIGFATAQEFLAEGAYVLITGRRKAVLDSAVKQLDNENVTGIQADSSKLTDLDTVVKIVEEIKGKLNILFVNAGIYFLTSIGTITEKCYDDHFNINVKGVLFTVQKCLPLIVDGGSIILNGSSMSITGIPASSVYSATKAAIRSFARCWSVDLKDRKIRVNTVSPGPIDTPMLRNIGNTKDFAEKIAQFIEQTSPAGRIDQPSEVAKLAVFLASNDSSYVTGIELYVDGGMSQV